VALVTPQSWWLEAGAIGTLFVFTFVVMSRSVQEAGITVSTVSTKISMVIPVLVNLFLLHTETELSTAGWIGLGLALPSIVLCSIPASGSDQAHGMVKKVKTWAYILLPLQLFLQAGIADTLINVANQIKLTAEDQAPFTIVVFAVCALWGGVFLLVNLLKGNQITKATLLGGIALGIPNFFSLYFLVKGLESFGNNGAIAFPIINLLTILIAAFVALLVFRDKFSGLNWLGLLMALAGIMLLAGWYNNLLNLFR
jgi:drug/metabolite transporter (DMT)-like permease